MEADIQLSIVIAPTSTVQYLAYECPEYGDYLREMSILINYWDFFKANENNKNAFSFVNEDYMDPKLCVICATKSTK